MHYIVDSFSLIPNYIIPFLIVLTVVVFFHELGHFLVARWCGVSVDVFSIGFGRKLFGWRDKKGTRWQVALIPLGGYVKFIDDANVASSHQKELKADVQPGAFATKSLWQKSLVVAAGPLANFILAIVIFALMFFAYGKAQSPVVIDKVLAGSAAEIAGVRAGDKILKVNETPVESFSDLARMISTSANVTVRIEVEREGSVKIIEALPEAKVITDRYGNNFKVGRLGVQQGRPKAEDIHYKQYNLFEALWAGVEESWFITSQTFAFIGRLFLGRENADQVGGVIQIAQVSGAAADQGIDFFIRMIALLSISIGLINLFPIPLLDGGHLLFYALEAIMRRPLPAKIQEAGSRIGLMIILFLVLFVNLNDVFRLFRIYG